ncbi:MAG: type 4a pilus biogenesis protein PilO [Actinomycetota bacterium]
MRRNILFFVLALIAVTVAYYFLVFSPQSGRITDASEQADQAEAQVRAKEAELGRLRALQQQAPQLRQRAAQLDTAMPNDPQLAQFILQVQDAANTSGVDWASVSPSPPAAVQAQPGQPAGAYSEVNVSMSVSGGYFQVQDFLARLENLSRAVKIGAVNLGAGPKGLPSLSASLTMKMFVSPAPAVTPAAPAATPTPTPTPGG